MEYEEYWKKKSSNPYMCKHFLIHKYLDLSNKALKLKWMQMIILMQLLGDYNGLNRQKACASKPLSIEGFHQPPPFFV
jgi:hypothetical protein